MRYFSWASFYEGFSDSLYFDVLLPRVIRDMIAREGRDLVEVPDVPTVKLSGGNRSVEAVAKEACELAEAYDVIFIHADTGGRALERGLGYRSEAYCEAMAKRCNLHPLRCISITPRHETEAWLLADGAAVVDALGYRGAPNEVGLPADARAAEGLADPKRALETAIRQVAGRRRAQRIESIFPAIAQRQDIGLLRRSKSFAAFEERLRGCLRDLRCIA